MRQPQPGANATEEQKQGAQQNNGNNARANVGIEEDFLNALPEDVRREVEAQGMPSAAA